MPESKSAKRRFRVRLRFKFSLIVAFLVALMGMLTLVFFSTMSNALWEEHRQKGLTLAGGLAVNCESLILLNNVAGVYSLLQNAREGDREVVYSFVLDKEGNVLAHTFEGGFPSPLLKAVRHAKKGEIAEKELETEEGLLTDMCAPVMGGEIGEVHLGLSKVFVAGRIADTRNSLLLVTGLVLATGLATSYLFGSYITKPLVELAEAADRIGKGEFDQRISVVSNDEVGLLALAFNRMSRELDQTMRQIGEAREELQKAHDELEERVKDRTLELAIATREMEAFSYSVSHDLRTPLRGIDGFSLAVMEDYGDKLDDTGRDYLRRIRSGCVKMGALIDDLLTLSRITRSQMNKEPVDLSQIAVSVAAALQEGAPDRKVEFVIEPGLRIFGDASLLHAAMTNLLGNAFKFTRYREGARIEFGAAAVKKRKIFYVRDNGAGFDMQYSDKLFGAFQRLHTGTEFEGTGIGLATVKRIIHRHGGDIWATGAPGEGATFNFTLEGC
ncbi:HAMP domain-containing protein [bacterium]|nr:MAG: HAMP domain-containing protein [bacterium]